MLLVLVGLLFPPGFSLVVKLLFGVTLLEVGLPVPTVGVLLPGIELVDSLDSRIHRKFRIDGLNSLDISDHLKGSFYFDVTG